MAVFNQVNQVSAQISVGLNQTIINSGGVSTATFQLNSAGATAAGMNPSSFPAPAAWADDAGVDENDDKVVDTYNSSDQLVSAQTLTANGAVIATISYAYSPDGNTVSETYTNSAGVVEGEETDEYAPATGIETDDLTGFNAQGQQTFQQDSTITSGGQASATISGDGDIEIIDDATLALASGAQASIVGSQNAITAATDVNLTLSGGSDNAITLTGASATLVDDDSEGDLVTVVAGVGAANVELTNGQVTLGASDGLTFEGSGNTIGLNGSDTADLASGDDDAVTNDVAGSIVDLAANTSVTVSGAGGAIGVDGTGVSATASDDTIYTLANTAYSLTGASDTLDNAGGVTTDVFGSNDMVNLGASNTLIVGSGDDDAVTNDVAGSVVDLDSNTTTTIGGSGGSIGVLGAGITVTASNETENAAAGASYTLVGAGDVLNSAAGDATTIIGDNDTLSDEGGVTGGIVTLGAGDQGETLNISSGTIEFSGSVGLTVNSDNSTAIGGVGVVTGTGNAFVATGTVGSISVAAGTSATLDVSNATINAGSGATVNIDGQNDIVDMSSGTVNYETASTTATVDGADDDVISAFASSTVTFDGTNENVNLNDGYIDYATASTSVTVHGVGDTVDSAFKGVTIGYDGQDDIADASSSTINLDTASTGAVVTGSNDTINAISGAEVALTAGDNSNAIYLSSGTLDLEGSGQIVGIGESGKSGQENLEGTDDTVYGASSGDDISVGSGETATIDAIDAAIGTSSSLSSPAFLDVESTGDDIDGSDAVVSIISGASATINGYVDDIYDGESDSLSIDGGDDPVFGNSTDKVDYTGGTYTGDYTSDDVDLDGSGGYDDANLAPPSYLNDENSDYSNIVDPTYATDGADFSQIENYQDNDALWDIPISDDDMFDDSFDDEIDPLVLNLASDPVSTVSDNQSSAYFDAQNNGQAVKVGWTTPGEGFLVYDPNNAPITTQSQLLSGFSALEALAQSGGVINANNPLWGDLKVWVNAAGNGVFNAKDLFTLSQLGITSINLDATTVDEASNGNTIAAESTFTYANGSEGSIAAVDLSFNPDQVEGQLSNLVAAMAAFQPEASASPIHPSAIAATSTVIAASHV